MVKLNDDKNQPLTKDFRGEIHRFNIHDSLFNVIYTRAGMMRSGDFHPNTQFNLLLSGEVELTLRIDGKDVVHRKLPNELIVIPPQTPHLYRYVKDTVMFEWWDGPFIVKFFEPYRRIMEEHNKKQAQKGE